MALELVKQGLIVLGGTQYARSDGDQGDMPGYRLAVPHVILLQPRRFAFFVRDFNGPAMASDAGEPSSLPGPFVRDERGGRIRESSLAMIDDQALLPKVMAVMGVAVAVRGIVFAFVGDRPLATPPPTLPPHGFIGF